VRKCLKETAGTALDRSLFRYVLRESETAYKAIVPDKGAYFMQLSNICIKKSNICQDIFTFV
jgi:hypothetical protein